MQKGKHQNLRSSVKFLGGSWWVREPRPKNSPQGCFCPAGPRLFESTSAIPAKLRNTKSAIPLSRYRVFGGSWWIRTTEALSSRFTVCPHWPLGKAPIFFFLLRCDTPCRSVLDYYSKAEPEMQAFFSNFLRFFQKSLLHTLYRTDFKKKERPAGVGRDAQRGKTVFFRIGEESCICNGIVALLVVWPGPSDCSGMVQGAVCMIAGCFPPLSFDYDT